MLARALFAYAYGGTLALHTVVPAALLTVVLLTSTQQISFVTVSVDMPL